MSIIIAAIISFILGLSLSYLVVRNGMIGTLKIDNSKKKPIYRFEFYTDVHSLDNKHWVIFKVDNNARLDSQE